MSIDLYSSNWNKGFSFRNGIKEIKKGNEKNNLDRKIRIKILNLFTRYFNQLPDIDSYQLQEILNFKDDLVTFFIEEFYVVESYKYNRNVYFPSVAEITLLDGCWFEVFDFIEFWLYVDFKFRKKDCKEMKQLEYQYWQYTEFKDLSKMINDIFKEEFVSYRIIDRYIIPIEDEAEIYSIKESIDSPYEEVSRHIEKALIHLSDRKEPDYSNSIKESISSVEAMSRLISGEENLTLGKTLNSLKEQGVYIHEAMERAFKALYGYTSDSSGIRHSFKIGDKEPTLADAKFMLIACSAFNNYLLDNFNKI